MDDLQTYLDVLFDGLEGLVYSPVKTQNDWETNWFEWPKERSALEAHIRSDKGDIYISPAVYSEKRPIKENIKKVQTVWVDFDGMEKIDFKNVAPPSLIVQTSFESKVHCYWRVDPSGQTSIEDLNRRLTYYLGADNGGWDVTQLLRPPGTINYKRNLPVVLADKTLTKYALDQFDLIPAVQAPLIIPTKIEELIKVEDILREYKLPFKLLKMVNKESPGEPYRSSFLARLSNELAEEGLKHLEIVSLLKHVDERIKKYSDRQDQLVRLSQIADYALHKLKVENETVVYTFDQIHHHVETLDWIWPGWLPTTGFMILSSAPNVGKTQMMTQMAYCLKNGTKFLGVKAPDKHTPLVMSLEMDIRSLKYILDHQSKEWDGDISIAAIDEQSNFVTYENLIDQVKPTILLIDSLSELTDDDDNPASEAKRLMSWIKKIRRRYGLAVVLIHHNRKASEGNKKPKNLSDLYGAKDFARVADTVIQLWEDERLASKGLIEFSTVKVRFGVKEAFNIIRNENLWYRRESDDSSNRSKPTGRDKEGNTRKPGPSLRHRDSDNGTGSGTLRVRLGLKDTS